MIVTAPLRVPVAVGVNVIVIVQLPVLAARGLRAVQLSDSAKSPLAARLVIVRRLVPVLVSVTDCEVLVVLTTWLPKFKLEELRLTPGAVPVPLKLITCVPTPSRMVMAPVRPAAAVGVKVTVIVQVPLCAIEPLQVVVRAKSPLAVTLVIERLLVPTFCKVTVWPALVVVTTWLTKLSEVDVSETPAAVPVPAKVMTCIPAPSTMVMVPLRAPVAAGVNVAVMLQVPPLAATVAPHVVVAENSALAVMLVIDNTLVPVLVREKVFEALVLLTTTLPKL